MSAVISIADHINAVSEPQGRLLHSTLGLEIPMDLATEIHNFDPQLLAHLRTGMPWGGAARVLRSVIGTKDRVLTLNAILGILPAIAAKQGCARVIAFEEDPALVRLAKKLVAHNARMVETIFGRPALRSDMIGRSLFDRKSIPSFDLPLIVKEEKVTTLVIETGRTAARYCRDLPPSVANVLLAPRMNAQSDPMLDQALIDLVQNGFSLDPVASGYQVILFRRSSA